MVHADDLDRAPVTGAHAPFLQTLRPARGYPAAVEYDQIAIRGARHAPPLPRDVQMRRHQETRHREVTDGLLKILLGHRRGVVSKRVGVFALRRPKEHPRRTVGYKLGGRVGMEPDAGLYITGRDETGEHRRRRVFVPEVPHVNLLLFLIRCFVRSAHRADCDAKVTPWGDVHGGDSVDVR